MREEDNVVTEYTRDKSQSPAQPQRNALRSKKKSSYKFEARLRRSSIWTAQRRRLIKSPRINSTDNINTFPGTILRLHTSNDNNIAQPKRIEFRDQARGGQTYNCIAHIAHLLAVRVVRRGNGDTSETRCALSSAAVTSWSVPS